MEANIESMPKKYSLHRAKPMSVKTLLVAVAITLLSLALPLFDLPDWLPLLGAACSAALVYWVLNNPAEEFLIIQKGQLLFRSIRTRRCERLPLTVVKNVEPLAKHRSELRVECRDGSERTFQAYYAEPSEDDLQQLQQFVQAYLAPGTLAK